VLRHCHLALDGWLVMPIAYLSIVEDPKLCQQLILSFIGKFVSLGAPVELSWLETETLRFAQRVLEPFPPLALSSHLRISTKYARSRFIVAKQAVSSYKVDMLFQMRYILPNYWSHLLSK
jgi:hypothetical protein